MKYKIGDKVRVRNWDELSAEFNNLGDGLRLTNRCFNFKMKQYCGKVVKITDIGSSWYKIAEDKKEWHWDDDMFEPVNEKKIVITSDGTETLARLYEGKKVILTATAKCSPDDTFNFETGARIAFDRLIESPLTKALRNLREAVQNFKVPNVEFKVIKPKYYNGKVVCIAKNLYAPYTLGKVYEFKDGRVADDRGEMLPIQKPIKALEEWNNDPIKRAKFIPFVE